MKFCIKDFFSKCDQIRMKLRIWSNSLKKLLMENFIFCGVWKLRYLAGLWISLSHSCKISQEFSKISRQEWSRLLLVILNSANCFSEEGESYDAPKLGQDSRRNSKPTHSCGCFSLFQWYLVLCRIFESIYSKV